MIAGRRVRTRWRGRRQRHRTAAAALMRGIDNSRRGLLACAAAAMALCDHDRRPKTLPLAAEFPAGDARAMAQAGRGACSKARPSTSGWSRKTYDGLRDRAALSARRRRAAGRRPRAGRALDGHAARRSSRSGRRQRAGAARSGKRRDRPDARLRRLAQRQWLRARRLAGDARARARRRRSRCRHRHRFQPQPADARRRASISPRW